MPNADLSGSRMRLEVWGHVKRGLGWASVRETDAKGKGKQRELNEPRELEWRVLEGWDVDLGDLVPLPADVSVCFDMRRFLLTHNCIPLACLSPVTLALEHPADLTFASGQDILSACACVSPSFPVAAKFQLGL